MEQQRFNQFLESIQNQKTVQEATFYGPRNYHDIKNTYRVVPHGSQKTPVMCDIKDYVYSIDSVNDRGVESKKYNVKYTFNPSKKELKDYFDKIYNVGERSRRSMGVSSRLSKLSDDVKKQLKQYTETNNIINLHGCTYFHVALYLNGIGEQTVLSDRLHIGLEDFGLDTAYYTREILDRQNNKAIDIANDILEGLYLPKADETKFYN